jgi:3,4-dihydroxy 2-butanone 4-phosphate synthase/GTP cyclohydrolase II
MTATTATAVKQNNTDVWAQNYLASPDEIITEARAGRMFILVDDEARENEGDLIIPAAHITPAHIAFMAREGRGLICLAMTGEMVDALNLPLMGEGDHMKTAFTMSIEAREGVTTGISAFDRAHTIRTAIAAGASPRDIITPGHIFPLRARDGGIRERAGHTEAAVDIARLAGLTPAGVICEIMNDDGTMARLNDLIPYAQRHGMKIGTIAALIKYLARKD